MIIVDVKDISIEISCSLHIIRLLCCFGTDITTTRKDDPIIRIARVAYVSVRVGADLVRPQRHVVLI